MLLPQVVSPGGLDIDIYPKLVVAQQTPSSLQLRYQEKKRYQGGGWFVIRVIVVTFTATGKHCVNFDSGKNENIQINNQNFTSVLLLLYRKSV